MTLPSLPENYRAAVFGASGGIGLALVEALSADPRCAAVHAGARAAMPWRSDKLRPFTFDLSNEASIKAAASQISHEGLDVILVATGRLHGPDLQPEKSLRALELASMMQAFAINAVGPAAIAKHMLPSLPQRRRSMFAVLSARVGSTSDNNLGGWHSYRASKAALNMLVRTFAIEHARTHPSSLCVALHPGTVDTRLSKPFQTGLAPERLFSPALAAGQLLSVLDALQPAQSGRLFGWDGKEISP